jgi:hypothetical protein
VVNLVSRYNKIIEKNRFYPFVQKYFTYYYNCYILEFLQSFLLKIAINYYLFNTKILKEIKPSLKGVRWKSPWF